MTRVTIPQLDANLVDVTVTAWKKAPGDAVIRGETIAELTTDKAAYELEAPADGELLLILAPEKSVIPTGYIVALTGAPGEEDPGALTENERIMAAYRGESPSEDSTDKRERKSRVRATPKARRLARQHNLDLEEIQRKTGVEVVDEDAVSKFIEA